MKPGSFTCQHQLAGGDAGERNVFCVADFCNPERMRKIFLTYGVEIVFQPLPTSTCPSWRTMPKKRSANMFSAALLALLNVAQSFELLQPS